MIREVLLRHDLAQLLLGGILNLSQILEVRSFHAYYLVAVLA
jgi:hypothetical protein